MATLAFPKRRKIPNKVRHLIYWTALRTGFRSSELKALKVSSLVDNRLELEGKYTKNGEDADQPLPSDLASELAEYIRDRKSDDPLFPNWDRAANMLKKDLSAANIPYQTVDGVADFHALRNTYCTDLIEVGVDIKTAHVLMRHKSIEMTMSYARTDDARKAEAVRKLAHRATPMELPAALLVRPSEVPGSISASDDFGRDRIKRLFGTDNLDDLQLLGRIRIEDNGDVILSDGPFAGEWLCSIAEPPDEPEPSVYHEPHSELPDEPEVEAETARRVEGHGGLINPIKENGVVKSLPQALQVVDSEGLAYIAPCRTRTYNPLIKSQAVRESSGLLNLRFTKHLRQLARTNRIHSFPHFSAVFHGFHPIL